MNPEIRRLAYEQVGSPGSDRSVAIKRNTQQELDGSFVRFKICDDQITKTKDATMIKNRELGVQFFLQAVLQKNATTWKLPIDCEIAVGLHDKYGPTEYEDIFVFSKNEKAKGQILIPDLYAMYNYNSRLEKEDFIPFDMKQKKAFFIGGTTGSLDASENRRLLLCEWAQKHPEVADCYISGIVQIPHEEVYKRYPNTNLFLRNYVDIPEQRKYQFLVNMDGNTCAWDRLPWILASQSVAIKERTPNVNWYYPLLKENTHYLAFDEFDEIPNIIASTTKEDANRIISNANKFVKEYLVLEAHMYYMACVLHFYSNLFANQ